MLFSCEWRKRSGVWGNLPGYELRHLIKTTTTMNDKLAKKVDQSIRFLQAVAHGKDVELAYSGGKDSDVILELAKMSGIKFRALYKNTTIDPPGTIKHCKDNGVEILRPALTFAQLIQKKGCPTRWSRHCCKYLKEYKIGNHVITGVRRAESTKRAARYKEPTQCRIYGKNERVEVIMPILEWTDDDVEQFIAMRGIKCHPLYYDEQGVFHVERRLGCLCCPLISQRKRIEEFRLYPRMVLFYARNAKIFLDTHPNSKAAKYCRNEWEMLYLNIFTNSISKFNEDLAPDLWGNRMDCERVIKDYFNIND